MIDIDKINKVSTALMKMGIEYRVEHREKDEEHQESVILVNCDCSNDQVQVLALEGFYFSSGFLGSSLKLKIPKI